MEEGWLLEHFQGLDVPFLSNGWWWWLSHLDSRSEEPVVAATVKVRPAAPAAVQEKRYIMVISAPMAPSHTHNMAGDASRRASACEQSSWSR